MRLGARFLGSWAALGLGLSLGLACGGQHATPAAPPAAPSAAARARCCAQCIGAASRDPTGADLAGKTCTSYPVEWNGGPGVDDDCRAWFVAQPRSTTIGDCRGGP